MEKDSQFRLANLLSLGAGISNVTLVRALKDRTWIFFEFDEANSIWEVTLAGLALMAVFDSPERAALVYKRTVPICGWSYETAASLLTRVPAKLLTDANKAFNGKLTFDEIIQRLKDGQPLIERGTGPRIIDVLSDPGK